MAEQGAEPSPLHLLDGMKAEDLQTLPGKPIFLRTNDTLAQALQVLLEANILSAPVKDEEAKFVGFVSVVDVVATLLDTVRHSEKPDPSLGALLLLHHSELSSITVKSVCGRSSEDAYVPVKVGSPLRKAVELMAANGVHRVPVVNDEGEIVNLITESGVIQYLAAHINALGDKLNKTVEELGLGQQPMISIHIGRTTREAFELMVHKRISAVGVVDDHNNLIANISAKDVRTLLGLNSGLLEGLQMPIRNFIVRMHELDIKVANPAMSCHKDTKLGDAMLKLAATRIHRLYVVQQSRPDVWAPIGVVGLRDVLCILTDQPLPKAPHQ